MKTLLLLRHAHTAQGSPTGRDFDRPLTEQGRAAALLSGQLLRQKQLEPDLILCSPAVRAHQTADCVIDATRFRTALHFYERIYEASAEGLIELIAEVSEEGTGMILVIGHNPGLQELLSRLTGQYALMHPATLARIDLDITDWSKLRRATMGETGRLVFTLPPEAAEAR